MMMDAAAPLAQIMGPNEDMAVAPFKPDEVLICQPCALGKHGVGRLLSSIQAKNECEAAPEERIRQ